MTSHNSKYQTATVHQAAIVSGQPHTQLVRLEGEQAFPGKKGFWGFISKKSILSGLLEEKAKKSLLQGLTSAQEYHWDLNIIAKTCNLDNAFCQKCFINKKKIPMGHLLQQNLFMHPSKFCPCWWPLPWHQVPLPPCRLLEEGVLVCLALLLHHKLWR